MAQSTDDYLVVYEPDQRARALELLLWQDRRPRLEALTAALAAGAQLAENTSWGVIVGSLFDSAEGETLDRIGELVGQQRGGLTHEQFRLFIGLRIEVNSLFPSTDNVWSILSRAVAPSVVTSYLVGDGIVYIVESAEFLPASLAANSGALIRDFRPAGIYAAVTEQVDGGFVLSSIAVTNTTIGSIAAPGPEPIGRLINSGRSK